MMGVIVKPAVTPSSRERMVQSAALLFRERGIEATSFSDVIDHSGAPRGSIYHHFPGGKAQLAEEATRWAGDFTAYALTKALAEDDPVAAVRKFAAFWRGQLRDSDCRAGCPVAAAAVAGSETAGAREAAGAVFDDWSREVATALKRQGVPAKRAASVATTVIAAIEGALIMARAQRSLKPLEQVADELELLVSAALA
jgi:AcrR family transcriptional regulator